MTTKCSNNHPPILHDEFYCPLCVAVEDHDSELAHAEKVRYGLERTLDQTERERDRAEEKIAELEDRIDALTESVTV